MIAKHEWYVDEEELLEEEEEQEEDEEEEEDRGDEVAEDDDDNDKEEEGDEDEEDDEEDDEEEVEDKDDKEDEDEDDDEDDEDSKKSQTIPRPRFDQVYEKFKTERQKTRDQAAKIADLEKKLGEGEKATSTDDLSKEIKATRKKMLTAIDDGKTEEAEALMDKIDQLNDQRIDQRLNEGLKTTSKASTQEVEYNLLVEKIEDSFPIFDEASEHYDGDLINEVLDIQQEFERAGNAPALALEKSMRYFKDDVEESMKAAGLLDPDDKEDVVKKSLKSRKVESKKRNKKAKNSQPAKSGGSDNTKGELTVTDLVNMSEDEFDKLSEAKIRELRGDLV